MTKELSYRLDDRGGVGGDLGPEVGALLGDGTGDAGALHLALGVDDDTSVVLEVDDDAILAAPLLALADHDGRDDLLAELGLAALHRCVDDVADGGSRQTVQVAADTLDGDDEQVAGTGVVGTVDDGAGGQSERDAKLVRLVRGGRTTHWLS
eukprot:332610_1